MTLFVGRGRPPHPLRLRVRGRAAAVVIRRYSSSFGLASRLLGAPCAPRCATSTRSCASPTRSSTTPTPTLGPGRRATGCSTWLEERRAPRPAQTGYSANLVVHAFARTASPCGIEAEIVDPFFASMRTDLDTTVHTPETLRALRLRLGRGRRPDVPAGLRGRARRPARAGRRTTRLAPAPDASVRAFQKLNFLRDLADDHDLLRRDYFPDWTSSGSARPTATASSTTSTRTCAAAAAVIPHLPAEQPPRGPAAAHDCSPSCAAPAARHAADEIRRTRVRVPTPVKPRLAAGSLLRRTLVTLRPARTPQPPTPTTAGRRRLAAARGRHRRRHRRPGHRRPARLARATSVDLLEKNDDLGGRVGIVEQRRVPLRHRRRRGTSCPRSSSTSSACSAPPPRPSSTCPARPELPRLLRGRRRRRSTCGPTVPATAPCSSASSRAPATARRLPRSARDAYDLAAARFLYTSFDDRRGPALATCCDRGPPLAGC